MTPLQFFVRVAFGFCALVAAGLFFAFVTSRREPDGPPDAHGDVPNVPPGARS